MYQLEWEGMVFEPKLTVGIHSPGLGCYAYGLNHAGFHLCYPISVDGEKVSFTSNRYGECKYPDKVAKALKRVGLIYLEDPKTVRAGSCGFYPKHLVAMGFDPVKEFSKLLTEYPLHEHLIKTAVGSYSLYVFGDSIGDNAGWTGLLGPALQKAGQGTVVASPGVANPTHVADQYLCRAYFWIPPKFESVAIEETPRQGTRLARDIKSLEHNIKKTFGAGRGIMYKHNPNAFQFPEEWQEPVPEPVAEPPKPVVRRVRARKPRTLAGN